MLQTYGDQYFYFICYLLNPGLIYGMSESCLWTFWNTNHNRPEPQHVLRISFYFAFDENVVISLYNPQISKQKCLSIFENLCSCNWDNSRELIGSELLSIRLYTFKRNYRDSLISEDGLVLKCHLRHLKCNFVASHGNVFGLTHTSVISHWISLLLLGKVLILFDKEQQQQTYTLIGRRNQVKKKKQKNITATFWTLNRGLIFFFWLIRE